MTHPAEPIPAGVAVDIRAVSRTFQGGIRAVNNVTLKIVSGSFTALIGPSGCGKSTLLRMIAGLDRPDAGSIDFGQSGVRPAFVFQDAHLLPWRNVLANVALPLELAKVKKADRLQAAITALDDVGLADAVSRYPAELSGGMRMRVSLARALVSNPNLLLLDEPFAALDEITRQRLDSQLHDLWQRRKMTVLFVTHSIHEAAFLAERVVVLSKHSSSVLLDRQLVLAIERTPDLRTTPDFAAETKLLYDALAIDEVAR